MARGRRRLEPPTHGNCPLCGQRMLLRFGVLFTNGEADFLDTISRSGARGTAAEVLRFVHFPQPAFAAGIKRVSQAVCRINGKLVETDIRIINIGRSGEALYAMNNAQGKQSKAEDGRYVKGARKKIRR